MHVREPWVTLTLQTTSTRICSYIQYSILNDKMVKNNTKDMRVMEHIYKITGTETAVLRILPKLSW